MAQAWTENMTAGQWTFIIGYPILWVAIIYVFLNYVLDRLQAYMFGTPQKSEYTALKDNSKDDSAVTSGSSYGATEGESNDKLRPRVSEAAGQDILEDKYPSLEEGLGPQSGSRETQTTSTPRIIEEGDSAGNYDAPWTKTFDFQFLVLMVLTFSSLVAVTSIFHPEYFLEGMFWAHEIAKFATMVAVSLLGGLICRRYCPVDQKGYIITSKSSWFKVNYTRKLQHFAAYMIPLVLKSKFHNTLSLAWGDFFTMLAFFVLIKPFREASTFFMLQFNSLDRPEDRPHTLDWIIVGNIAPGFVIILFFKWLFALDGNASLVTIIVYITGIGDGLAEPVGIYFGRHKYSAMSCVEGRAYQRSWEGSACVFMSGMFFPAMQYASFGSFNQLAACMLAMPPIVTYLEATAPHTMDSPVLMAGSGIVLLCILYSL